MVQPFLQLFGNLSLQSGDQEIPVRTKKQQRWIALLAYLAVQKRAVSRQKLARVIWGDVDDPLDRLRRHTLDELKRRIGSDLLEVDKHSVRLCTEMLRVDVNDFHQSLADYRLYVSTGKVADSGFYYLERAVSLYTGDFLGDYTLPDSEEFYFWQIEQANSLRQDFYTSTVELMTALCIRNEVDKAQYYANVWRKHAPDNVDAHAWMLALLELKGNDAEAKLYTEQLQPLLDRWHSSGADLRKHSDEIHRRLRHLRGKNRYASVARDQAISRLLTDQLDHAEFDQAKDNPAFFEGYLNVLSDLAERSPVEAVKIAEEIADALFDLKDKPTEAKDVLDRAEAALNARQGDFSEEAKFRLLLQRLNIYRALGLTQQAVEMLDTVAQDRAYIDALNDDLKAAWYLHLGLIQCWVKGDYENALESLLLAQKHFRLSGQFHAEAGVLSDIGLTYWNQGQLLRAEEALRTAKERALHFGNHRTLLKITGNLGLVYLYQGRVNEAYALMEEHYRLASELGHLKERRRALGNRGIAKYHLGDYRGAIEDLEADLRAVRAVNEGTLHATVNLSRCYIACGDVDRGFQLATWALEQAQEKHYLNIEIIALRALAECLPPQAAYESLRAALQQARGRRRIDEAAALISLSKLATNPKERDDYWQEGAKILRQMGAQAWLEHKPLQLPTL